MDFSFPKKERLREKKQIATLFEQGRSINDFPIKLIYLKTSFEDGTTLKTMVVVPKKKIRGAVKRNRIKRLLRETFRLNKHLIFNNNANSFAFAILYLGKEMPNYHLLNKKVMGIINTFNKKVAHVEKK